MPRTLATLLLSSLALAALTLAAAPARAFDPATPAGVLEILQEMDRRQNSQGDWKALVYLEVKEKEKTDQVSELLVFRRDDEGKLMFLFTKPKAEAGKGYLRLEKNLWMYDPATGRWERRTERERIGGSDTRRGDLDASRLAEEYDGRFEGAEKLGAYQTWKLTLKVKPGVDVDFPVKVVWVDRATLNTLKLQDLALSGKLSRTTYYPRWKKVYSQSKKADTWYPEEIRTFDEIEKGKSTLVLIKEIDLRPLEANMFTKAWLESKSR